MEEIIFKAVWIVAGLVILRYYAKRKSTLKSAFFGMAGGGAALVAAHYFGGYIGFAPDINLFNTIVSLILGIPGVALIMAINIVF